MDNEKEMMITCGCGATFHKYYKKRHFESKKHRTYLGEDCPRKVHKERVKNPDKSKIHYIMRLKVADCDEDQLKTRRQYIAQKMREHRARKKETETDFSLNTN